MTIPNPTNEQLPTEQGLPKAAPMAEIPPMAIPGAFAVPPAGFPLPASASLYVGELHPDVNEAVLFELFNQVGPVASVRVCRDAITRRSLGYGYVNFHNVTDGERALDALNYHPLKGHPIRIMWSQRDPALRRSGAGNVFIKNLEKSIDNKALHDTFSAFGNILSCKVVTDEHGASRGFGFVHFETAEAADQAIAKVNGMLLNDIQVFVGHHVSRRERVSKLEEAKARFTNVYVKNLDETVTEQELNELFAKHGEITSSVIQRDSETGQSRGFGFVNFAHHDSASAAVEALNNFELKGKNIVVCRAQSKAEREDELRRQYEAAKLERISKFQGVNLFIKNLEESVDEDALRALFEPHGTLTSLKIMRDEKGISKGFGFICFSTPEEAQKALSEMNGKMVKEKPIFVAFAQRKEDRQSLLEAQYHQRLQYRQYMAQQSAAGGFGAAGAANMYPQAMFQGRHPMAMMNAAQGGPAQGMPSAYNRRPMGPQGEGSFGPRFGQRNGPMQGGFRPSGPRPFFQQQQGGNMTPGGRMGMMSNMGAFQQRRPQGAYPPMGGAYRTNQGGMGRRYFGQSHGNSGSAEFYPTLNNAGQSGASGLTAGFLASLPVEAQKQLLGERLFPMVLQKEPVLAQKITGMLLEMDNGELLHLLESPETLYLKVSEAAATAAASSDESSAAPASEESNVSVPAN